MAITAADIRREVKEKNVTFLRLMFSDILGVMKNVEIPATDEQLDKVLSNKAMFDGSSIEGFVRINESDMYLYPDLDTWTVFPWGDENGAVAGLICDIYTSAGEPFAGDPRGNLKKALRHSDYTVRYVVRGFNVEEAKQIIRTRPQQLSLQEMFLVAQTYEKGSNEFNEVFDVAVRMFPDDPTANINAAAIELQRGDLQQSVRYLDKADAQASATLNNRGVLKLLQGDLDSAESYFKQAQAKGSVEAGANLEEMVNKRKDDAIFGK